MAKSRLLSAVCATAVALLSAMASAAVLPLEGRLETATGSGVFLAYYDPNLDITWANGNINSLDTWDNQVAWAAGLTIGGITGWRLPIADVNGDGTVVNCAGGGVNGCEDNEMGFLYWEESITPSDPGPFSNVPSGDYWSGTEFARNPGLLAWTFQFRDGLQDADTKTLNHFAWAVHSGDVPLVVPLPAAVWLFGSGLLGFIGIARRKKA